MRKKGVILLITILFIAAMSVLVLKNLDDSETFMKNVDTSTSLKQTQISIENINGEFISFFKKYKDNVEDLFDQIPETLPFQFGDSYIYVTISRYYTDNLYDLNDVNLSKNVNEEFSQKVSDTYTFFNIVKEKKKLLKSNKITNNRQIDDIISEYISLSDDDRILDIKDNFTFINFDKNESSIYVSCKYDLNVENIQSSVNSIFKIGDNNVTLFEYTMKGK